MSAADKDDERIVLILEQIRRFSLGDYGENVGISRTSDGHDSVCAGLNDLANSLRAREEVIKKREERISSLVQRLRRYTQNDFSERAAIGSEDDDIDALAFGLNSLAEEIVVHNNRLEDSETQLETIFKNAPDAVVVIDSRNVIVRWNPAAKRIFGWTEEEVTGKFLSDVLVPERYRERHLAGISRFLETGEFRVLGRTIELQALCKNNSEIEIELTISAATSSEGYLFISFIRDITARKKAEELIRQMNATLEERVRERTAQLNASEAKYRHLFENNPMPLWVLDRETLRFLDVNESALKLYGYSREEFLGMTGPELRPEAERARYLALNRQTFGTQNTGVWTHLKKDGSTIQAEVTVHEMTFEGKRARLILANDVTEKMRAMRELQVSEGRFRRVFNSNVTGFSFWDAGGRVREANDLFLQMVGYTREELLEGLINIDRITAPEYTEADAAAREQIRISGVCEPFEKEYIRKDGTRLPVMIGAANIDEHSNSIRGVTCVMDISQRKQMEQEIRELNRNLEVRISERTQALLAVNKELESFTYSVSHDLRAPLRAIHGYSQMLFEDYESKLDQEGIRLLNAIKFNAKQMGQLVDDLLAFSRMGKRPLAERDIDLTRLVREVAEDAIQLEKKRVKIKIHPLGTARVDEPLLRQAFQNLISNALKYSSKKDHPEIEIGATTNNDEVVYFVKDNGAGFDMAYYKKLFGVFQRLHQQDEFEGTGVGLAIVQRIVQRHGGRIWAEGRVGAGAVFYFTLGKVVDNTLDELA